MNANREKLINLLDKYGFEYLLKDEVLHLYDMRTDSILENPLESDLSKTIRNEQTIFKLDLSKCKKVPKKIKGFKFIEEIVMPKLTDKIPRIVNCPNLYNIEYDASTITIWDKHSFKGWPHQRVAKFSESLTKIVNVDYNVSIDIVDLSACSKLVVSNNAFQLNHSIQKVIFPDSIKEFPRNLFWGCDKLKSVIAPGIEKIYLPFEECKSLSHCIFSPKLNYGYANEIIKSYIERKNDTSLLQTGIILETNNDEMILFSFTNFKYYYAQKVKKRSINQIITFRHDIKVSVDNPSDGYIVIRSNYNDYHAVDILPQGISQISNLSQYYSWNLQRDAIEKLKSEIGYKLNYDIENAIENIINTVNRLDINEIINSYHTVMKRIKPKKVDDNQTVNQLNISNNINLLHAKLDEEDELDEIDNDLIVNLLNISRVANLFHAELDEEDESEKVDDNGTPLYKFFRSVCYSDPYIDTILPCYHSSNNNVNGAKWDSTDTQELAKRDEKIRKRALKYYSKKKHISSLLCHYIQPLIDAAVLSEKSLHISRAKDVLEEYKNHNKTGFKKKVKELNKFFSL